MLARGKMAASSLYPLKEFTGASAAVLPFQPALRRGEGGVLNRSPVGCNVGLLCGYLFVRNCRPAYSLVRQARWLSICSRCVFSSIGYLFVRLQACWAKRLFIRYGAIGYLFVRAYNQKF